MSTQRPQPQRPVKPPNPRTPITRSGPQPKFGGGNEQPPSIKKDYLEWKRKNRGTIQTPRPLQPGPGLFPPKTKEQLYYRALFDIYYPNCGGIIPYYWMPRFVDAKDASARTLPLYTN